MRAVGWRWALGPCSAGRGVPGRRDQDSGDWDRGTGVEPGQRGCGNRTGNGITGRNRAKTRIRTTVPGKAQRGRDNGTGKTGRDRSQGSGTGLGLELGLEQRDRDQRRGRAPPWQAPTRAPPAAPPTPRARTLRTAPGCVCGSGAGLCWSISASTTTGAEHPGMRTYCLGAETPEELNAWVCALRRGAAPLPRSPSPPLPARCPPLHPPCCTSGPPLPPNKVPAPQEEAPTQGGGCGTPEPAGTADHAPRPRPELTTPPMGRSQREPHPPGAATNQQPPPPAGSGRGAEEQDPSVNQTPACPMDSSDWLLPFRGTAFPPTAANETSPRAWEGLSGRGSQREGVAGSGARRPIRITLLQASF
ncbi:basic proline-rich protein-like isoform X1 [Lathamus discolor]|uniref:basic proline-rich protein-like isoform X1 n=1 Tax=Lathamus discolor TaxID=678569 RepID=UPI0032B8767C